jgi:hypothetical protein
MIFTFYDLILKIRFICEKEIDYSEMDSTFKVVVMA